MRRQFSQLLALALMLALVFSFGLVTESEAGRNPCNPCAAKKMNPCNPCAAKMNPCNPCAAKANPCNPCAAKANPCNPCAAKANPCNPCNPCAAKSSRGPAAQARMIIAKVLSARHDRLAVTWQDQTLHIAVSGKTQFRRGAARTSVANVKPGEQIIVSMLDRKGNLNANYVYLAKASAAGNPCNPCAAKNPCNPCAAKMNPCNPCAAKANPCNPCAAKMNPCNPCAAKANPCNPCAAKMNPCNPCGAKKKW